MRRSIRFTKKLFWRVSNLQTVKYLTILGVSFKALEEGYRFYDDYAWKKEGLRRLKHHFFDKDRYVRINGLDFLQYLNEDYVIPMIHLQPNNIDEVRSKQPDNTSSIKY